MGRKLAKCLQNIAIAMSLAFVLLGTFQAQAGAFRVGQSCGQLFDQTGDVIAYIADLSQNQKLSTEQMSRLYEALKKEDKFINPYTEQDAIKADVFIHWQKFEELVKDGVSDKKKLAKWLDEKLKEKEKVKTEREHTGRETQDSHAKIQFHPVKPGKFMMGGFGAQVSVELTHPFEMMSTAVTQRHWVEMMGENPSHFAEGAHTIELTVNGKKIRLQPDNPVEQVTWWSALEYANRRSIEAGLRPVYDFSEVRFKAGTRAEDGTLDVESGEMKINAPDGDIYLAEGFRLPTDAENEYMLRATGTEKGAYHFGDNEADLKNYAWYKENANRTTHPVAQLLPLVIDGKEFYDLHGNVWEWNHDRYAQLKGGRDPRGPKTGSGRVIRGGSWSRDAQRLRSAFRSLESPDYRYYNVGFRLVRTKNNP